VRKVILLLAVLLPFVEASAQDAWPELRGDAEGTARLIWNEPLDADAVRQWRYSSGGSRRFEVGLAVWASPAIADVDGRPTMFIGGYDQTLHALDLFSKQERWSRLTNGPIASAPAVAEAGTRQVVFFTSSDRTLYACDAGTGKRVWTRELIAPTATLERASLSAPFVHEGTVYVTCFAFDRALSRNEQKGELVALDAKTGQIQFRREVWPGFLSSPVGVAQEDESLRLFVASRRGRLTSFVIRDGSCETDWEYQMAHEVFASPVLLAGADRSRVFLGSKFGQFVCLDATMGDVQWKAMAGNWIDNTACAATVDDRGLVFVGSHDYCLYAFDAETGDRVWRRRLGGEVYSAPCFFEINGRAMVAAAALDNHLYVIDALTGDVVTSFFTGQPVWDKVSKGETLWGSPVVLQAGAQSAIIFGSYSGTVFVLPVEGECAVRAKVQSASRLWWSLGATVVLFFGVLLPTVLLPGRTKK
jgi:outer membrane protein assembly factor BamB